MVMTLEKPLLSAVSSLSLRLSLRSFIINLFNLKASFLFLIRPSIMTMDAVHDYEYYEAFAKGVKFEDITSSHHNANILASLRDNDAEFNQISIVNYSFADWQDFVAREGDDLGWLGYFVGRSKQLETLCIDSFPNNINAFMRGLGQNRSVQTLQISVDLGESFKCLIPFLRNNESLRKLSLSYFDVDFHCARNIALLLDQQSSLKRLEFDEAGLDDEGLKAIAAALKKEPKIEELILRANNDNVGMGIGRDGCIALGNALEDSRKPKLKTLVLTHIDIEDEGLNALVAGLRNCHKITSLTLVGNESITEAGSRSLSTLFQSGSTCRLKHLDLGEMNIDDDGMAVLATGLASLPSLRRLNLGGMSIGDQGLQGLVGSLVDCDIEELRVSSNMFMESVSGLRSLGTFVRRKTNMRSLGLRDSSLTDEALQSFVEGVAQCCSLKTLDLSRNRLITANGLTSLSSLLRAEHCTLCTLDLFGVNIGDDGATALANGLIGNKSLATLRFNSLSTTARGWATFSRLLCDTSNLKNTYLSNHTLLWIGGYKARDIPQDILQYTTANRKGYQVAVICKILHGHPDIDVTLLLQWKMKCLPLVVAWLEKAKSYLSNVNESTESFQNRQLSAVYKFIRGMPQMVVDGYRRKKTKDNESNAKKRKRKDELTL